MFSEGGNEGWKDLERDKVRLFVKYFQKLEN